MKYEEYVQSVQQATKLVERGDYDGAIPIFRNLLSTDIAEFDKAMMCLNLAVVYGKMGKQNEALVWYSAGSDFERRQGRFYVAEKKAAFLAEQDRVQESLAEYQEILGRPELTENDKERIRRNIELLRGRVP